NFATEPKKLFCNSFTLISFCILLVLFVLLLFLFVNTNKNKSCKGDKTKDYNFFHFVSPYFFVCVDFNTILYL
ncbi:hypothetical protein, partial [Bacillus cereus]|uniref:hypothetical protein n=1 Tax=Bacillus cereus TaxID=1396 RepID=UPI003012A596